jgi:mannose-1-phosphate guanylyltransferase
VVDDQVVGEQVRVRIQVTEAEHSGGGEGDVRGRRERRHLIERLIEVTADQDGLVHLRAPVNPVLLDPVPGPGFHLFVFIEEVGVAVLLLDPDAVMVVMPSDHVISPEAKFQETISRAVELVNDSPERIVTFGIKPTYPAETFGYIERGETLAAGSGAYHVSRFREKPDAATAQEYLDTGSFYWNSGIFVWRADTILAALATHEPDMYKRLQRIADAWGTSAQAETLELEFAAIQGTSIDYAVMERHAEIAVIEATFVWDDVGSWQSLTRLQPPDEQGNTLQGKVLALESRDCIVRSEEEHLVVTLGTEGLIVVHTEDATLVTTREREEGIREVVEQLKARGWEQYL